MSVPAPHFILEAKAMKMNNRNLNILRKIIEAGYTDEKTISTLTAEDMVDFCRDLREMKGIIELQKAVKANTLIAFLTSQEE